jgi:hypothetical protein
LRTLAETYDLPLVISGDRWDKVYPPEVLTKYVVSGGLKETAYREGMWQSKINLAFVTQSNEEDVAHKAFEITACGAILLACAHPAIKPSSRKTRKPFSSPPSKSALRKLATISTTAPNGKR